MRHGTQDDIMTELVAYGGLFLSAFIAATILPAQSEVLLGTLLQGGAFSAGGLLVAASLGNILGALLNYVLGRGAARFRERRWFPVSAKALGKAETWYRKYGRWSLLLSWAPIIGDPITVAAGLLREPVWVFLVLVTIAKVGRYLVIAALVLGWM